MILLDNLDGIIAELPNYRKDQIYGAIFKHAYEDWEQATDLPLDLRAELSAEIPLTMDSTLLFSGDGRAVKALIRLNDDKYAETVLMKANGRNSICVSTQVGCSIRCPFCASGKVGFVRNLTISEIVGQVLLFSRFLKNTDEKVTNIVFMGVGEPFLNYDNVMGAIKLLNREDTLNLSARRFSISTAGILPGIEKLRREKGLEVNLAISLHSAIDKKRNQLVPINKKYPLKDLAKALRNYFEQTRRKIMIEYVLIKDTNTFEEDAVALRDFINTVKAAYVVNLIPLNETYCGHKTPTGHDISNFKEYLKRYKISFIQRFSFGKDINAACGQLALKEKER